MKRSTRSQQTPFTKKVIKAAKAMIDNGADTKDVFNYIEEEFKRNAADNLGMVDNLQYQKAVKAIVEYI